MTALRTALNVLIVATIVALISGAAALVVLPLLLPFAIRL